MAIKDVTKVDLKTTPSPAVINCKAKPQEKVKLTVDIKGTAEKDGTGTISALNHDLPENDQQGHQKKEKDTKAPEYNAVPNTTVAALTVDKDGNFTKTDATSFELFCEDDCTLRGFVPKVKKAKVFVRVKYQAPDGTWHYKDSDPVEVQCK